MNDADGREDADVVDDAVQDDAVIGDAFRKSIKVLMVFALIGGGIAVWSNLPDSEELDDAANVTRVEERAAPEVTLPEVPWTDVTAESGIRFIHQNGATGEKLLPETMGGGCAFWDYDADGDPDILFVNSRRWTPVEGEDPATLALYQNDGTGRFVDVTRSVGLDVSVYGMGCAVGDFDNDGRVDLFVSTVGENRLFRNTGERFIDVTTAAGVAGEASAWSTSCGWFDYDRDGDLDLFVANYVVWSRELDLAQPFTIGGTQRAYGRPQ